MGIYEAGLRKSILTEVAKYVSRMEEERAAAKLKGLEEPQVRHKIFLKVHDGMNNHVNIP